MDICLVVDYACANCVRVATTSNNSPDDYVHTLWSPMRRLLIQLTELQDLKTEEERKAAERIQVKENEIAELTSELASEKKRYSEESAETATQRTKVR